ncbi:hypothetical protein LEQ41_08080 [Streptococcus agalactiae]|nr:hypothetical protein [Streptococcus agalactiae]
MYRVVNIYLLINEYFLRIFILFRLVLFNQTKKLTLPARVSLFNNL